MKTYTLTKEQTIFLIKNETKIKMFLFCVICLCYKFLLKIDIITSVAITYILLFYMRRFAEKADKMGR